MADLGDDDAAAFQWAGLQRTPLQEQSLTPSRKETTRLIKASKEWEQNPVGIFSDEQRAIAGAAPTLGEEVSDLLLRLATEVRRVAGSGKVADVQNAVLDQLAKLREEVTAREQEDSAGNAGGGPGPGTTAAKADQEVWRSTETA
jgi:hypothetical protein